MIIKYTIRSIVCEAFRKQTLELRYYVLSHTQKYLDILGKVFYQNKAKPLFYISIDTIYSYPQYTIKLWVSK